jgi:transcriptional regulator with XRE-family HTH domain
MSATAVSLTAGEELRRRRKALGMHIRPFAEKAGLPYSLVAGLETGHRRIGEKSVRKLISALNLRGAESDHFLNLFLAAGAQRVLAQTRQYPPEIVNVLAQKLSDQAQIPPELITACTRRITKKGPDLVITLKDGQTVFVYIKIRRV